MWCVLVVTVAARSPRDGADAQDVRNAGCPARGAAHHQKSGVNGLLVSSQKKELSVLQRFMLTTKGSQMGCGEVR